MERSTKLILREPFDERTAWEVASKGWYNGAAVELPDGSRHRVFFYDPVRLSQDLQLEIELGRPCLAEGAMIILPEITEPAMLSAVEYIYESGWFQHLRVDDGGGA